MTTVLSTDPALMCAAELQDLIEFLYGKLDQAIDRREKRSICDELDAAIKHYNRTYGKTYTQPH